MVKKSRNKKKATHQIGSRPVKEITRLLFFQLKNQPITFLTDSGFSGEKVLHFVRLLIATTKIQNLNKYFTFFFQEQKILTIRRLNHLLLLKGLKANSCLVAGLSNLIFGSNNK